MKYFHYIFFLFFCVACITYTDELSNIHNLYYAENYSEALKELENSSLKSSNRNRLLYYLEKARILEKSGQLKKSRTLLMQASKVVDELYTVSISKTAATFIYNESASEYEGEIFEKVAIHTLLALSFIQEKDYKSARVEARQINFKLKKISNELGDKNNSYRQDAFALYLSGIIYEVLGDYDDAIIDYRKALNLYRDSKYKHFFHGNIDTQIAKALYKLALLRNRKNIQEELLESYSKILPSIEQNKPYGEIIAFHEVGRISLKRAHDFFIPIDDQVVRLSFPYIDLRKNKYFSRTGLGVVNSDKNSFFYSSNVADMSSIAHYTLEERRMRLILKGIARILLKTQLTEKIGEAAGPLGQVLANVYSVVTETADTRSWTLLPDSFYTTRIQVEPGTYDIALESGGQIQKMEKITVEKNKIYLIR